MEVQQLRYSNGDTAMETQLQQCRYSHGDTAMEQLSYSNGVTAMEIIEFDGINVVSRVSMIRSRALTFARFYGRFPGRDLCDQMMACHGVNAASFSFYWQFDGETIQHCRIHMGSVPPHFLSIGSKGRPRAAETILILSNSHGVSAASFSFHWQQRKQVRTNQTILIVQFALGSVPPHFQGSSGAVRK